MACGSVGAVGAVGVATAHCRDLGPGGATRSASPSGMMFGGEQERRSRAERAAQHDCRRLAATTRRFAAAAAFLPRPWLRPLHSRATSVCFSCAQMHGVIDA